MKYDNEEQIRKDFARLFDWFDYKQVYGYSEREKKIKTPEWAEIFCKVGQLIEATKETGIEYRIDTLEKLMEKENE